MLSPWQKSLSQHHQYGSRFPPYCLGVTPPHWGEFQCNKPKIRHFYMQTDGSCDFVIEGKTTIGCRWSVSQTKSKLQQSFRTWSFPRRSHPVINQLWKLYLNIFCNRQDTSIKLHGLVCRYKYQITLCYPSLHWATSLPARVPESLGI